jgi:hypothetical protein
MFEIPAFFSNVFSSATTIGRPVVIVPLQTAFPGQ